MNRIRYTGAMVYRTLAIAIFLTGAHFSGFAAAGNPAAKVRVYILAGQSNMEEKAALGPMAWQIGQEAYRDRYRHLVKDGDCEAFTRIYEASIAKDKKKPEYNFAEREDVWISNHNRHANLSANYMNGNNFGLEVNFGFSMGDRCDEQVLLIKTAWGGRSIDRGFRPPSAMPSDEKLKSEWQAMLADLQEKKEKAAADFPKKLAAYEAELQNYNAAKEAGTLAGNQAVPRKPQDPEKQFAAPPMSFDAYRETYGVDYRNMIAEVKDALANIGKNHPAYKGQGYEIKGFVWFQGFNDMFAEEARNGYAKNLVALVNDVKQELGTAKLQVVIGQLGHDGDLQGLYQEQEDKATGKLVMSGNGAIRKAQLDAAMDPAIKDFTTLVRTAPFWDMEADAIYKGPGSWNKNFENWIHFGGDRPYHYYGSPWFFSQTGTAFANAMIALEEKAN